MEFPRPKKVILAACLCAVFAWAGGAAAPARAAQGPQSVIVVAGRTLTGPHASPQQRGGRLFLPLAAVARALGDTVRVDAARRTVEVRRQTGVVAEFDAALRQVSENGSPVLSVSETADLVFPPAAEELLLPAEIVSALLDASVRVDEAERAVRVERGRAQAQTVRPGARRSPFELYQLEYDYNLNSYAAGSHQTLSLRADGRLGDGRFQLLTSSAAGRGRPLELLNNFTFNYERPGGQRYTAGDFGTGTDLLFMSSAVRGASAQIPFKGARLTAFGGRAVSGFQPPPQFPVIPDTETPAPLEPERLRYDTNVFGAYASFGPPGAYGAGQTFFSAGVLGFDGPGRRGQMLTAGARYASTRARLQGDLGAGRFEGTRSDGTRADGLGVAADLSASYDLSDQLTVHGRFAQVGGNFLGPQAGLHEPLRSASAGASWRPREWLSASFAGSLSSRPGADARRERFVTATLNLTPNRRWPSLFLSHTRGGSGPTAGTSYTLVNAAKEFSGWRLFLNATRVKTHGLSFLSAQAGAHVRLGESGSLQFSQSFGSRGSLAGAADWNAPSLLERRVGLGVGLGYQRSPGSPLKPHGRLFASARLPRQSSLQFTYMQGQSGPQYLLSLRGPVLRPRSGAAASAAPLEEMQSYGSFQGRVYQDVDLDGRFSPGLDRPQANVRVRLDGSRHVVSDANGIYRLDNVRTGEHEIGLDLLSVRADLTLLDGERQAATLDRGRDSVVDFRLVRTGRVSGLVWLDADGDGRLGEGETPLADVRVLTGSGRDTLTDEHGVFLIGDLPPGEHLLLIDEQTLPAQTVSPAGTLTVKIQPGGHAADTNFPVTPPAPEIKRF